MILIGCMAVSFFTRLIQVSRMVLASLIKTIVKIKRQAFGHGGFKKMPSAVAAEVRRRNSSAAKTRLVTSAATRWWIEQGRGGTRPYHAYRDPYHACGIGQVAKHRCCSCRFQ